MGGAAIRPKWWAVYARASACAGVAFWLCADWGWYADLPTGREVMFTTALPTQFLVSGVAGLVCGLPLAAVWRAYRGATRRPPRVKVRPAG